MGHQKSFGWCLAAVVIVTTATLFAPATSAVNLNPVGAGPIGNTETFITQGARLRPGFWAGTHLHYAEAPLVCRDNIFTETLVERMGIASAVGGFGLADGRFQLSLTAPVQAAKLNTSDSIGALCYVAEAHDHLQFGMNDPVVSATYVFWSSDTDGFSLSLNTDVGVPVASLVGAFFPETRDEMRFFGDRLGALSMQLNPGFRFGPFAVSSSVGASFRPSSNIAGRSVGSGLNAAAGASINVLIPRLYILADVFVRTLHDVDIPIIGSTSDAVTVEAMAGFRYSMFGVTFGLGLGSTALNGPGSSALRAMATLSFESGRPLPSYEPVLNLTNVFNQEVIIIEVDEPIARKRRRKKKRDPPCPDPSTLSPEERLFLPKGCEPEPEPESEPDPYEDQSFEEVMCADAIAAVCSGAGKLPPIVDRAAHFEFALNDSVLTEANLARLRRIARFTLPERRLITVVIVGHADALGSDETNDVLALARAQAVADALIGAGIEPSQIEVSARGEKDPLVDVFDTVAGAPSNRRVDLTLRYEVVAVDEAAEEDISVAPIEETQPTTSSPPASAPRVPIDVDPPATPAVVPTQRSTETEAGEGTATAPTDVTASDDGDVEGESAAATSSKKEASP